MTQIEPNNPSTVERLPGKRIGWRRLLLVGSLVILPMGIAYHYWGRCKYQAYHLDSLIQDVRISEAVEFASQLDSDPRCSDLCLLAVRAHRLAGDLQSADRLLVEYESTINSPLRLTRERTLNRVRSGQLAGADSQLPALLRDPNMDSRDVSESFAIGLRLNRRFEEAAMLIEAWKQDWPVDFRPHYHEALMRQTLTDWELAIASYRIAIKLDPSAVDCRIRLGECLSQLRRDVEAIEQFEIAIKSDPHNPKALLGLANGLKQQGEFSAARSYYLKLLHIAPANYASRLAIAQIDFANDDLNSAYETVVALSGIWPEDVATLYLLSQTQAALTKTDESKTTLAQWNAADSIVQQVESDVQTLAANPNDVDLQVSIGARMLRHYSREMGHQFVIAALQIRPGHSEAATVLQDYVQRQQRVSSLPLPSKKANQ